MARNPESFWEKFQYIKKARNLKLQRRLGKPVEQEDESFTKTSRTVSKRAGDEDEVRVSKPVRRATVTKKEEPKATTTRKTSTTRSLEDILADAGGVRWDKLGEPRYYFNLSYKDIGLDLQKGKSSLGKLTFDFKTTKAVLFYIRNIKIFAKLDGKVYVKEPSNTVFPYMEEVKNVMLKEVARRIEEAKRGKKTNRRLAESIMRRRMFVK